VGNADTLAYYIEAKYKLTAGLYAAARWNQQFYGTVSNGLGGQEPWDNDMLRLDLALGYRFSRHFQAKIQYSFGHREGNLQQGEQLVAAQVTMKF
jgi:predicted porin